MKCVICNKTEDESYENHEKRLKALTSSYTSVLKQLPRECTCMIVEYIIGNNPWYSIEVWNWVCYYTSYFEKDYDYEITCKNACRSCLEASTLEYYNIHGITPCKLSDYLVVDGNEIRGESPDDLSFIYSHKNIYFRDFVCDGWRNTPHPYHQKNLLNEDFITL